jgi:hypothetical protein
MWLNNIFDSHFGSYFGYNGGHLGCSYVHKCFYDLVNVTNDFIDIINLVIDTRVIVLGKGEPAMWPKQYIFGSHLRLSWHQFWTYLNINIPPGKIAWFERKFSVV